MADTTYAYSYSEYTSSPAPAPPRVENSNYLVVDHLQSSPFVSSYIAIKCLLLSIASSPRPWMHRKVDIFDEGPHVIISPTSGRRVFVAAPWKDRHRLAQAADASLPVGRQ